MPTSTTGRRRQASLAHGDWSAAPAPVESSEKLASSTSAFDMWLAGFVACTAFGAGGFGAGGFGAGGLSHHCFLNTAGAYRKGCHTVSTGISCGGVAHDEGPA